MLNTNIASVLYCNLFLQGHGRCISHRILSNFIQRGCLACWSQMLYPSSTIAPFLQGYCRIIVGFLGPWMLVPREIVIRAVVQLAQDISTHLEISTHKSQETDVFSLKNQSIPKIHANRFLAVIEDAVKVTNIPFSGLLLAFIALLFHLFHYLAVGAVLFVALILFQCVSKFDFHTASQSLVPIGICVAEPVCMIITW